MNVSAFKRAWRRVIERHGVLRTAFFWEGLAEPLQVVQREVPLPLEEYDWRELSVSEQQELLAEMLQQDREREFQLSKAPLIRLFLVRMSQDAYEFVWSRHHLLLDGWSQVLVLKEVLTLYEVFCYGEDVQYDENDFLAPSRPYTGYIEWLHKQDLSRAERFWRGLLRGFTSPTPLGQAEPISKSQKRDYREEGIKLSSVLTTGLQALARQYELTLNTFVQGLWALLLSQYSGKQDVLYGVTVSGRPV